MGRSEGAVPKPVTSGTMHLLQSSEELAGPLLIAYLASWGFQGVLCVQVYTYYIAFPRDRLILKILVYGVFILEFIQSILTTKDAFATFANGFGNPHALIRVRLLWLSMPILGGIVASIGRMFLAYRLHALSRSWAPTLPVIVLATLAAVAALLMGGQYFAAKTFLLLYKDKNYIMSGLWNGSSAACDVVIAASMVYYLLRQKAKFNRTHARITRLIRLVVETGALTATISTLNFLLFVLFKWTSYFAIPAMIVAKLYSNTMLLALNNRIAIVGGRDDQITGSDYQYGIQDLSQWELRNRPGSESEQVTSRGGNAEVREDATGMDQLKPEHNLCPKTTRPAKTFCQK